MNITRYCEHCSGKIIDGKCNKCGSRPTPTTPKPPLRVIGANTYNDSKYLSIQRDTIAFEYMKSEIHFIDTPRLAAMPEALERAEYDRKKRIARESYQMADIMMEERDRKGLDIVKDDGNPPRIP